MVKTERERETEKEREKEREIKREKEREHILPQSVAITSQNISVCRRFRPQQKLCL